VLLLLQGAGTAGPDSGEVYFAPQQELPPVARQQQQQQQGGRRAVPGLGAGTQVFCTVSNAASPSDSVLLSVCVSAAVKAVACLAP
jgi:hypothetical protein